jgi:hypothetical protein
MYGESSLCPICNISEKTLQHVFTCQHTTAVVHRNMSLNTLLDDSGKINSPPAVVAAIEHGFKAWSTDPETVQVTALTAGSLQIGRGNQLELKTNRHDQGKYNL